MRGFSRSDACKRVDSSVVGPMSSGGPSRLLGMPESLLDRPSVRCRTVTEATTLAVADLEPYRRELTGYCYRMLGSGFEAEDAVQETMVRAWRGAEGFEGRAHVRSWLYRIATNVCIDMGRQVQRRARPME